jgi:hypothetical protein
MLHIGWPAAPARTLFPLAFLPLTAHPLAAQAAQPAVSIWLHDSVSAAAVACQVAQAPRPKDVRTRCLVEALEDTGTEYVVRIRERSADSGRALPYPRSEVRLRKDRTTAVLTRIPEL